MRHRAVAQIQVGEEHIHHILNALNVHIRHLVDWFMFNKRIVQDRERAGRPRVLTEHRDNVISWTLTDENYSRHPQRQHGRPEQATTGP